MRASIINQYPGESSTGSHLSSLLEEFSDRKGAQFRALVAFASEGGLERLRPALENFFGKRRHGFWIVGVDLNGTSRQALEVLVKLKSRYEHLVDAKVFSTGDNRNIFHPKVYWFDAGEERVVLVGSSNLTSGGLERHFETAVRLDLATETDGEVLEELDLLWMSYASPRPPLSVDNIQNIDLKLTRRFRSASVRSEAESHPLSDLVPPLGQQLWSPAEGERDGGQRAQLANRTLVMDVFQETRQTQVQFPVAALDQFLGNRPSVVLRRVQRGYVVKEDRRPVIHLSNYTHRVEIDAIKGVPRPLIIKFWRPARTIDVVEYEVFFRGTVEYRRLDALLDDEGQQTREGARRWLVW